jgi:hypothetical protein
MKARQLIGKRAYGPDTLKVIISSRAEAVEGARLQLANILLGLAREDSDDPESLKKAALQGMASIGYPVGDCTEQGGS